MKKNFERIVTVSNKTIIDFPEALFDEITFKCVIGEVLIGSLAVKKILQNSSRTFELLVTGEEFKLNRFGAVCKFDGLSPHTKIINPQIVFFGTGEILVTIRRDEQLDEIPGYTLSANQEVSISDYLESLSS